MMSDVAKTPREELECKKKYLYEHSMFWECNDGSKCQIIEEDVCDLLNELNKEFEDCEKLLDSKDDFIHKFKRDIEELGISIKLFEDDIAIKDKKIEEQQATIRRLQDLCGESDGENAKLRIENKMLEKEVNLLKPTNIEQFEQIQKLQEENRELRKELDDCEKFRYQVFKRLNDEHIKECSIK